MAAIQDRYVDVGGLKLHYRESGSPDGVPVVALHGHPSTAGTWDALASGLTVSGRYRVLALTQRGYGLSARSSAYSLEALRDDVFGFVDALGLGPFVLVGHSMGATVATLVAELDADRLVALVLVDAVPPPEGMGFPGAGHRVHVAEPELFLAEVSAFLDGVVPI